MVSNYSFHLMIVEFHESSVQTYTCGGEVMFNFTDPTTSSKCSRSCLHRKNSTIESLCTMKQQNPVYQIYNSANLLFLKNRFCGR